MAGLPGQPSKDAAKWSVEDAAAVWLVAHGVIHVLAPSELQLGALREVVTLERRRVLSWRVW